MGRPATCLCGDCNKCRHRLYMREWYAGKPGYAAEMARKHRERAREYELDRYHNNDEFRMKKKARNMVIARVAAGTLARGNCEVCGEPEAQAHHDDYAKPLDVRWLCNKHHREHHGEQIAA
jgi:hypothetical protein